jgi:hypothetical protein
MARKTLLNESEIRRFMKLANMKPIGDQRLAEMGGYMSAKRDDEDEDEPGMRDDMMEQEEDEMDMKMDMDMDKPAEDPMDEPEMDMDMDEPKMDMGADAGVQINLDDFLSALEGALEKVTGEEVSTDMDMEADEGGDDEAADMELDMDMDAPEGDMDMDDDKPGMRDSMMQEADDEDEDEDPGMRDDMMEARVERIAKRVAERLMTENKKASNIDALTERIFQRLAGK